MVSNCQPERGIYGFHLFGNMEELLPVLNRKCKSKRQATVEWQTRQGPDKGERELMEDVYVIRRLQTALLGRPANCSEVFAEGNMASGLYVIRPHGSPSSLSVYCDMNNGGGWTVFQRRRDGEESFDRCVCVSWVEYKHGFGDLYSPDGEFWLGNTALHNLTSTGNYDLRIDMQDFEGNQRYAEYKNFKVDDEKKNSLGQTGSSSAPMTSLIMETRRTTPVASDTAGPAGGSAGRSVTQKNHTRKERNNKGAKVKMAIYTHTGYTEGTAGLLLSLLAAGNLNGHYYRGPDQAMADDGVVWYTWHGWWYSIKSVVMMVRAADLEPPPQVGFQERILHMQTLTQEEDTLTGSPEICDSS
ncbi:hypothetical protein F7725_005126 [Dissostichus mawsoni]|uniref:Fibrinogen-like protein 1 n=1 Tax=Dissostichus mawsoni TaxID=36200 RepID=A0A7J5YS66_DISMA|nr:hypothetical protein F7725_005126 [Dissostichus mawsoni]